MRFATKALHAGHNPDKSNHSITVPIYSNTAFSFEDLNHAADLFDLKTSGDIYTRISNPTNNILEERLAELEGGVGALVVSSGQSASLLSVLNIVSAGDEIVASSSLYGGTTNLFAVTLKKLGIKTTFVASENPEDYAKHITDKTKCIYTEFIGNPKLNIADVEGLAKVAHRYDIPLIVDSTVATPYLSRPFEFGADIVIHSTSKYIGGHGNSLGGVIIDSGKFDWSKSAKFKELVEPDPSYHGMSYVESFKEAAYITKARVQLIRDLGTTLSPFNAFLILQGIETLNLRMERHSQNAYDVAKFLENHSAVEWVNYPKMKNSPYYDLAQKYFPKGASSLVTFGIKGGQEAGAKFIDSINLLIHATNIGDSRSIITYPALTTHRQLNLEQLNACGISSGFMRLSIGLEDVQDIIEDINQALNKSQG
ncbi:MAG: O-acetylhomoserine aminocarboxypropyltransferase/cysteine synthase family protein [Alphaproteobacteria bacterium]